MDHLLLIDDCPGVREIIGEGLMERGFQVTATDRLDEGLRLAQLLGPDCILLDLVVPPFDRNASIALIPTLAELADVIVCSGCHAGAEVLHRGAIGFFHKGLQLHLCIDSLVELIVHRAERADLPRHFLTVKEIMAELAVRGLPSSRPYVAGILRALLPAGHVVANRSPLPPVLDFLRETPGYRVAGS